ncbi:MAG TPA: class I SAM-dependent methyltransferase [Nocardioides sp.]|uniref:class I SAM-dependent methyltransferase n=1 Tax=Nocardioides sp. TaxID=35761 RepID=UPI002CADADE0|nr:class I SAM-dependent methyltransferase [Nocardioides sp.]HQR26998.1 class I SAM-dependent methyltransferase [Nocardioides sp.]
MTDRTAHWDAVYAAHAPDSLSWYEPTPETSLRLVLSQGLPRSVIDIGAGASTLAEALLERGVPRVAVLDLSVRALSLAEHRAAELGRHLTTIAGDVVHWVPEETYEVWHDRAVFHFLTDPADRAAYLERVRAAVPRGLVVVGTFAEDGPERCSGLPTARYSPAALQQAFGEDFELLHAERTEHHTPSGAVQPFTWGVLRLAS